jgi:hypothetical protein
MERIIELRTTLAVLTRDTRHHIPEDGILQVLARLIGTQERRLTLVGQQ